MQCNYLSYSTSSMALLPESACVSPRSSKTLANCKEPCVARLTFTLGKQAIKLTRSLTWKIWKPIGQHLLSRQCWRRVTFTLLFPGPAGTERGKQGLVWKEGKFLLPPAFSPFFQHPCSCTVSHSPAGRSSQRAASMGGGFSSLSKIRKQRNKMYKTTRI